MLSGSDLRILVIGTPAHEGRMAGRAFELLGVEPQYVDPGRPVIPTDPRPDVVIVSREWNLDLRRAVAAAHEAGIPTVYLMDGVLEWSYLWENWSYAQPEGTVLQPLLAGHLCVIGRHPARLLAALGLAERIHVVGLPRLDGLPRERTVRTGGPKRIIVATARTYGHNVAHRIQVRAALRDLRAWFEDRPEITPIWRIEAALANEIGVTPTSDGPLVSDLHLADAVFSFTSTLLLESMLLGIPTAQIDYRPVPQYVQTAWEIRSRDQIEQVVQEILSPPPERMAFQEFCLRDELEPGDAAARLAEVLRTVAEAGIAKPPAVQREDFGVLDYRQVHSHLTAFSLSPISRVQYELDALEKLRDREQKLLRQLVEDLEGNVFVKAALRMPMVPPGSTIARLLRRLREAVAPVASPLSTGKPGEKRKPGRGGGDSA
jgi:hypothetical protein